jgi:hypothetical protein
LHLLETIKGAGRDPSKKKRGKKTEEEIHTLHSHLETRDHLPVSLAYNPYYKHFGAR